MCLMSVLWIYLGSKEATEMVVKDVQEYIKLMQNAADRDNII